MEKIQLTQDKLEHYTDYYSFEDISFLENIKFEKCQEKNCISTIEEKFPWDNNTNFDNKMPKIDLFEKHHNNTLYSEKKKTVVGMNMENKGKNSPFQYNRAFSGKYYGGETIDGGVSYFKIVKKVGGSNTYIYNIYDIRE
ncbi:phosphatidylinositol 4-kinase, putative, partial [Plasmodium ovale curtisi]